MALQTHYLYIKKEKEIIGIVRVLLFIIYLFITLSSSFRT